MADVELGRYELIEADGTVTDGPVPAATMGRLVFGPWPGPQRTVQELRLHGVTLPVGKTLTPGDVLIVRLNALAEGLAYTAPVNSDADVDRLVGTLKRNLIAEVERG